MTEPLIEKLQYLDAILHDIRQRYDVVFNELNELKSNPQSNTEELEQLQQQLIDSQNTQKQASQAQSELEEKLNQLDESYQSLAEAHHELNDKYTELLSKCDALEKSNQLLLEKNRLAKEHTKIVMKRLTMIDQAVD